MSSATSVSSSGGSDRGTAALPIRPKKKFSRSKVFSDNASELSDQQPYDIPVSTPTEPVVDLKSESDAVVEKKDLAVESSPTEISSDNLSEVPGLSEEEKVAESKPFDPYALDLRLRPQPYRQREVTRLPSPDQSIEIDVVNDDLPYVFEDEQPAVFKDKPLYAIHDKPLYALQDKQPNTILEGQAYYFQDTQPYAIHDKQLNTILDE